MTNGVFLGAIAMAAFAISLIFARLWVRTRDRFFLFFAAAFAVMGLGRIAYATVPHASDHSPIISSLQLLAFVIIIVGIIDKNRSLPRKA